MKKSRIIPLVVAAGLLAPASSLSALGPRPAALVVSTAPRDPAATTGGREGDRDAGSLDIGAFVLCCTGPEATVTSECLDSDLDGDGHVDLHDFAGLQVRFTEAPPPTPELHLWRSQQPLAAPETEWDPDAPVVDVAAEAAATPPVPEDLEPTIDVQITQEIIDKAAELGAPEAIYEFVRNQCAFQAYYGSRKGSVETLRQRSGNDYDLASLLIALFRASEIPARYGVGIVEMPVDQVTNWLAVDDADAAASILYTNGLEGLRMMTEPDLVAVQCRRIWVEAYVSSGAARSAWVPLDPAFALNTVHGGQDIPEEMGLDAQAFVDEYRDPADPEVTLPRSETPLELLEQEIVAYLDVTHPGMTLADAMRTHEIVPETSGEWPSDLPYIVRSRDLAFSAIPADRRYQIRFHLHDNETDLVDHTVDLPVIAGKRVTISYIGASSDDEVIIDSYGGLYETPPYLVDLKPVLRMDGQDEAVGAAGVGMGRVHASDIYFLAPVNDQSLPENVVPAIYNTIVSGASQAIGLAIEGAADDLAVPPPTDDTEGTASLLYDTAMDYLASGRNADLELGQLMHAYVTSGVAGAIVENSVDVSYDVYGEPQAFDWGGLRIDADRSVRGIWPVDRFTPPDPEAKDFMILAGAEGSIKENRILEDSYGQDAVSAIKVLELAADAGVTIYTRWDDTTLPANSHRASVRGAIEDTITDGHVVTFPADPITIGTPETGQWTGTGWIDMDPNTGAAAYVISGNGNAGVTVNTWPAAFVDLAVGDLQVDHVVIDITDPDADSPDPDALFSANGDHPITFEYEITVHYDNGPPETLPHAFSRTTRFPCKWYPVGDTDYYLWLGRWPFWSGLGSAQRTVTNVKIELSHIKFNHASGDSSDGVDIRVNGSTDVLVPEWITGPDPGDPVRNEPAAYKRNITPTIQARFVMTPELDVSATISATTADPVLGGLGEEAVSFVGGVSSPAYATFTAAESTPTTVGIRTVQWQWKAGNFGGGEAPVCDINVSGPHKLYQLLETPAAPMTEPWTEVLDNVCELAAGFASTSAAVREVWDDHYNYAGGLYDTMSGASQYTGATSSGFDLTDWLDNYPDIGVVNCYDMGKSVVVYSTALGCSASYAWVSSFGYLNCVKPIGCGWANNPFYSNPGYDPNPIVPGDWSYYEGRSSFGNHGFTRHGNGLDIFDASGGQVDIDDEPDYGPPHEAHELDGADNWNNDYKDRVIDDFPESSPSTPTTYSFSVY